MWLADPVQEAALARFRNVAKAAGPLANTALNHFCLVKDFVCTQKHGFGNI